MSDLVGNLEDRFSHNEAQLCHVLVLSSVRLQHGLCMTWSKPQRKVSLGSGSFKPLTIFCDCTARFVSDLVGNLEDRFSHNEAQLCHVLVLSSVRLQHGLCMTWSKPQRKVSLGSGSFMTNSADPEETY